MGLKNLAVQYYNRKIYVYPFYPGIKPPHWREEWNGHNQTLDEVNKYDWLSAGSIYAVAGKKGIRVLTIRVEKKKYRKWFTKQALELLGLPENYEWVVCRPGENSIIVETPNDRTGDQNIMHEFIRLYWQDYFLLPTDVKDIDYHFRYKALPNSRPTHITNNALFSCADTLDKDIQKYIDTERAIQRPCRKFWSIVRDILVSIVVITAFIGFIVLCFKGCNTYRHVNPDHIHRPDKLH